MLQRPAEPQFDTDMKLTYWMVPNGVSSVTSVGSETPAVGISVTELGSHDGRLMMGRAWVGPSSGAPPNMLPLNHSPSGMVMPSERSSSELRNSEL